MKGNKDGKDGAGALVRLHLCCCDRRGVFTGRVEQLEVRTERDRLLIAVHDVRFPAPGVKAGRLPEGAGRFRIGRVDITLRSEMVGGVNIYWNSVQVSAEDAARVLNYVRKHHRVGAGGWWTCQEGTMWLRMWWRDDRIADLDGEELEKSAREEDAKKAKRRALREGAR